MSLLFGFFFKKKTAYEMRISDWSSDVCSSDLDLVLRGVEVRDHLFEGRAVGAGEAVPEVEDDLAVGVGVRSASGSLSRAAGQGQRCSRERRGGDGDGAPPSVERAGSLLCSHHAFPFESCVQR